MNLFKGITSKYLAANISHDFLGKKLLNIHIHHLHATVFKEKSSNTRNVSFVQNGVGT